MRGALAHRRSRPSTAPRAPPPACVSRTDGHRRRARAAGAAPPRPPPARPGRPRTPRPLVSRASARRPGLGRPARGDHERRASPTSPRRSARPSQRARADGRELFGFAEHDLTSTYLGTSTGLRLRHDQPTGRVEIDGKSARRGRRSTWAGRATRDFSRRRRRRAGRRGGRRLAGWAERRIELPAGRYETILPPTAVADLMIYLYWSVVGPRRRTRAARCSAGPEAGPGSASRCPRVPLTLRSDPDDPGLACAPFVIAARLRAGVVGVRQRPAARRAPTGSRTAALDAPAADPARRPT